MMADDKKPATDPPMGGGPVPITSGNQPRRKANSSGVNRVGQAGKGPQAAATTPAGDALDPSMGGGTVPLSSANQPTATAGAGQASQTGQAAPPAGNGDSLDPPVIDGPTKIA